MEEPKRTLFHNSGLDPECPDEEQSGSGWSDEDWQSLFATDPQLLYDYQQEAEVAELETAEDEEDRLFAPYMAQRHEILYDDPPTYDCTEYEYTTDDFIEEFFGGPDSPAWEAMFP